MGKLTLLTTQKTKTRAVSTQHFLKTLPWHLCMETNLKPWCLAFPKLQEGTEASGLSGYVIRTTSMGRVNPERWWQQVTSHNHWHNPLARAFISWLSAAWLSTHRNHIQKSQIHQTKQGCAEGKWLSSFSDPLLQHPPLKCTKGFEGIYLEKGFLLPISSLRSSKSWMKWFSTWQSCTS